MRMGSTSVLWRAALVAALNFTAGETLAQQAQRPGAMGGGLIEFLVTGRSGGAPPPSTRPAMVPMRAPVAPPGLRPTFAPRPAPVMATAPETVDPDFGRRLHTPARPTPPTAAPTPRGPMSVRAEIDENFRRQVVAYSGSHRPGTVIVDTRKRYLFLVQDGGKAVRYGIGVGRPGFEWAGRKTVTMKREWPDWRPPPEMRKRRPDLPLHMPGGEDNPLGARALYLGSSLYRIHGTNEPHTIGRAVSSGCIRMLNADVIDLYNRVRVGTVVVVI
jgi:lipoprotein-anchoring transpeptidase ErfK/SrfK